MLDTGIDVPEVVNLVFFKIVRSRTKFWQMIGRGTRLRPELFGPGEDKRAFRIFDFCQNFEFFNQNPDRAEPPVGLPLGARLFSTRVELIGALQERPEEERPTSLLSTLRDRLHAEVAAMPADNFLVRRKRRHVERFQERTAWEDLSLGDRLDLSTEVAGLPTGFADDDIAARQFDLLLLTSMLRLLTADPGFAGFQTRIRKLAADLEDLANVPLVKAQLPLILDLQTDAFWEGITVEQLETVRRALRDLVRLIEPRERKVVYTDFLDEIGEATPMTLDTVSPGLDKTRFKLKVRRFLDRHRDHIAILKLRRAEALTPTDLDELDRIFTGIATPDDPDAQAEIAAAGGLGPFLRSLAGLDRKAAKAAFDTFLRGRSLRPAQTEFVDLVIDHLTEHGAIDPRRFYESPFTDLDDQGIHGLFPEAEIRQILAIVRSIDETARVA